MAAAGLARGGLTGGLVALILAGLWVGGIQVGIAPDRVAVALGALSVVMLGLLPRFALSMSGLTALDDRRASGAEVRRGDVHTALNAAHLGIALATIPIALSAAAAGAVMLWYWSGWTVAISVLLAFLLASRSRQYPLLLEVAVLCGAALAVLLVLTYALSGRQVGGALVAVGLLVLVAMIAGVGLGASPAEHVKARFTQVLDTLEVVAVVTLVPLALGVFGVYGDLLNAV